MTVTINGEAQAVAAGTTVGQVVDGLGRGRSGIAVAVNGVVVPRSTWDATLVVPGDRVEVLTAAQGG